MPSRKESCTGRPRAVSGWARPTTFVCRYPSYKCPLESPRRLNWADRISQPVNPYAWPDFMDTSGPFQEIAKARTNGERRSIGRASPSQTAAELRWRVVEDGLEDQKSAIRRDAAE